MSGLRFIAILLLLSAVVRQDIGVHAVVRNGPHFNRRPIVYRNPNPSVPLATIMEFETDRPVRAKVTVREGRTERLLAETGTFRSRFVLPVLGMRPGAKNALVVRVTDSIRGETTSGEMIFSTDPLPADFPPIQRTVSQASRAEPGVTMFGVIRSGVLTDGWLVAVDEKGDVVWYFR
jgi:arylsulfate sulfotransferase